ncbi:serine/threonine protein kinase [Kribbella flavida DSM 17836]|uniref:non-specific serine/threonine protein kinase n=1 Tax=Kribbella flavida (strain DSM 17836 / JCM 10339 / NBRC 14399) TaxID=479435 RepID=D2PSS6_KRIFD|nr:serine/threonine-protein kinase [Kribbella flavida]ADB34978.1 serine/threonine protein kinase [Kribbella flavida DSM 17836]
MTTIACTQPGCSGTIMDGYCDICGSPASTGAGTSAAPGGDAGLAGDGAPGIGAPTVNGVCAQPGCGGAVVDGYCDVCGTPGGTAASSAGGWGGSTVGSGTAGGGGGGEAISSPSTVSRASNRLASTPLGSARAQAAGSKLTRRLGTSSTRLRGARLGAGLTSVPPIPPIDASRAILTNPMVPEDRRNCPNCGNPVGRSRGDQPGRTEGFCPKCRSPFSFSPKLHQGDLVGGQYQVAGCLAHGGFGWIYLAQDKNVSDRWVVLKGLLNSEDPDAVAAAIAEQQFLAQVEHPLIVEIYNFVTHEGAGYIVMEYVGGTSLKTLLKQRMQANGGRYDPLPVDQAIAYLLEIMPAFSYLHDLGLVYCDFKPDNIIQVGDAVKLIDLGGVRRIDDMDSAIYGTVGYQAPEVPEVGTSVASDIYTLGRTLAVLAMEFRGYQSKYLASLPPVAEVPLFQEYDSFYRLLLKACAKDPADRFVSADELRVQLLGVLREVVAAKQGQGAAQHSTSSLLFGSPGDRAAGLGEAALPWQRLPSMLPDDTDKMAGWLKTVSVPDPGVRLELLVGAPESSAQVLLEIAQSALEAGQYDVVDTAVADLLAADPWEWRAVWISGLVALARNDSRTAQSAFNAVYGQVPGELAPKLALAVSCELSGEYDVAEGLYLTCARTDANYIAPSAFGLAAIRAQRGDLDGAVAALDLVPQTSGAYIRSRRLRAGLLAGSGRGLAALAEAMNSIEALTIDPVDRANLSANVFLSALEVVRRAGSDPQLRISGRAATEPELRDGLEAAYRELAGHARSREERIALVDLANEVRGWTLR